MKQFFKEFYNDFYELILYGFAISLYETTSSKETLLTIHVIHDGETNLKADDIEEYFWRAGLPTVRFINVNDIENYPTENINFFVVSAMNGVSQKVPFNRETFKEDLWQAAKTI